MNFVNWNRTVYDEFCRVAILKPREQEVMRMHVFTDYTLNQIADTLGYSVETIKADIRRCKKKYKAEAKHNDILLSAISKTKILDEIDSALTWDKPK